MNGASNDKVRQDCLLGGMWGLLFGSAFGEVRLAWFKEHPKTGSIRNRIAGASWSIEGAQTLCLLTALRRRNSSLEGLAERAVDWARLGVYFPDSEFGFSQLDGPVTSPTLYGATYPALEDFHRQAVEQSALLFVVPLLWNSEDNTDIQVLVRQFLTLGKLAARDDIDQAALVMTLLWAKSLVDKSSDAWQAAADRIRALKSELQLSETSIEIVINISSGDRSCTQNHRLLFLLAYVHEVLDFTKSFDQAVDFAMPPRPELRIPMMLTGAMAGLHYGMSDIPPEWITGLRGRELAKACLAQSRASSAIYAPAFGSEADLT